MNLVRNELHRIQHLHAKVYQTHVAGGAMSSPSHDFFTTSKDVHLFFGTMNPSKQEDLACLLDKEFREHECNELLLHYDTGKTVLVTKTGDRSGRVFTFAPAH
ncbi:MAG: hypothetical protein WC835_02825 [Candidatus Paceibacterota bacterium]